MNNIKILNPIPLELRDALSKVLEKRDYAQISIEPNMSSESTMRDLMNGSRISERSKKTVSRMIKIAVKKCKDAVKEYQELETSIGEFNK